jgi:hypothetical protein
MKKIILILGIFLVSLGLVAQNKCIMYLEVGVDSINCTYEGVQKWVQTDSVQPYYDNFILMINTYKPAIDTANMYIYQSAAYNRTISDRVIITSNNRDNLFVWVDLIPIGQSGILISEEDLVIAETLFYAIIAFNF